MVSELIKRIAAGEAFDVAEAVREIARVLVAGAASGEVAKGEASVAATTDSERKGKKK